MKKISFLSILFCSLFFLACNKDQCAVPEPIVDTSTKFKCIVTDSVGNKLKGAVVVLYESIDAVTNLNTAVDSKATGENGECLFTHLNPSINYFCFIFKGYDSKRNYSNTYTSNDPNQITSGALTSGEITVKTFPLRLVAN